MKKLAIIILLLGSFLSLNAQETELKNSWTDEYLDTVQVKKKLKLNDYSMIGVQYGASLSQVMWNPVQNQQMVFQPVNLGVTFTTYGKMFGYMPYFGFQAGVFYAREGYQFEWDSSATQTTYDGVNWVPIKVNSMFTVALD